MNAETFCEHFATFAEAQEGVGRLRKFILQLAVRGKLVPQDKSDEPASALVDRVRRERFATTNTKRRSASRSIEDVEPDEFPSPPPEGWRWIRLGQLAEWAIGTGFPIASQGHTEKPYLFAKVSDMNLPSNGKFITTTQNTIDDQIVTEIGARLHPAGTVIFPKIGGAIATNKRRILTRPTAIDNNCLGLTPIGLCGPEWLYVLLTSIDLSEYQTGTSVPALSQGTLELLVIGLPPLEEQKRIVAKVDQLLGLCDELAARQAARREARERLVGATLDRLVSAPSPAEFPKHAHRLRDNFDRLFDTPTTIPQLRQAILQLAVQGKLATQDPRDSPASALVDQISSQKKIKLQAKEIRQGKVSRPTTAHPTPDELPLGWVRVDVDQVCFKVTDGTHFTPRYVDSGVRFVSAKDIVNGRLTFDRCRFITAEEHQQLYRRCNPQYHDIVITKSGSIGSVALVEDKNEFSLFESLALLKFDQSALFPKFLVYALTHACSCLTAGHIKGVAVKHLHLDILRGIEIPLPPLAEQKRIVSRLTKLFSLCDALEAKLTQSESVSSDLLSTAVSQLLRPTG